MKLNICGYDVSISAKHQWMDKATKHSTMEFLNYLSIILDEATESYRQTGYVESAKTCHQYSNELYDFNKKHGLYGK